METQLGEEVALQGYDEDADRGGYHDEGVPSGGGHRLVALLFRGDQNREEVVAGHGPPEPSPYHCTGQTTQPAPAMLLQP